MTVTYRSEALTTAVGLPNLWIAFHGYWPERGATFPTATFKDLEVSAVLARRPGRTDGILVVASAGNTAAAFASACSRRAVPCVIVLAEDRLRSLRLPGSLGDRVKLVSLTGACDYTDAIGLADRLAAVEGFVAEGGTRNVARRDGLATTLLNAVEVIGELPRHYVQAVGSGAGGIAACEAASRLVGDRRFGSRRPRLVLSQNLPFAPLVASWERRQRALVELPDARRRVLRIKAAALSNRAPMYSPAGGLFDALAATDGAMVGITNAELARAAGLFRRSEGIDLEPEGAVALASLLRQIAAGQIARHEPTLLNITGAGRSKLHETWEGRPAFPHLTLEATDLAHPDTPARVRSLFD